MLAEVKKYEGNSVLIEAKILDETLKVYLIAEAEFRVFARSSVKSFLALHELLARIPNIHKLIEEQL